MNGKLTRSYVIKLVLCYAKMELAKETINGLTNIQNSNSLPEEIFLQLLENIASYICKNINDAKSIAAICPSKSDLIKTAMANILCLFIEAARHDYDEESLKIFLHNEHISGQRIEKLCNTYINNKQNIQTQLELTGNSIPHIVDIDWRLYHCVKFSTCRSTNVPIYNIQMITKKYSEVKHVTFTCTIQQLQELVYKLKDIVRHIEKMSNM
ncbi:COMM domain-containing protein 3 isoform X2 [Odontomachus brunneus]|uniref:COMM domain-containing protein 3 isoform X2 n=1 Tax=Odontomachus brunneus TaxID=486640 RepID=UPI0013F27658|nr:COMM domain-containing protein 3 isoform X2 [Odontomachus brunneus]XP_032670527.1 COMM domain-containing protein 3 isoform X2 [Odontomachus brunneus]